MFTALAATLAIAVSASAGAGQLAEYADHPDVQAVHAALIAPVTAQDAADKPQSRRGSVKRRAALRSYRKAYQRAADKLGEDAPGRNIARQGLRSGKPAPTSLLRESTARLRAMVAPPAAAPAAVSTAPPSAAGAIPGNLAAIAQCESGGDPTAVSADGTYRGLYQFDQQTWNSVGGSGDPAAASVQEQTLRAQMLMAQRGSSPWPVCGG